MHARRESSQEYIKCPLAIATHGAAMHTKCIPVGFCFLKLKKNKNHVYEVYGHTKPENIISKRLLHPDMNNYEKMLNNIFIYFICFRDLLSVICCVYDNIILHLICFDSLCVDGYILEALKILKFI